MTESLVLKWGSIKSWNLNTEASIAALKKFFDGGPVSTSAMCQHNTPAQVEAIIELIDVLDNEEIWLDWENEAVSKWKAKEYVRDYGVEVV
jgi:hypothetical protein